MLKFPASPSPDSCEWPGQQFGISNMITRDKAPDPAVPASPEDFDETRETAIRALAGKHSFIHDSIFQGLRVRFFSNSHHLADFWRETTWSVREWHEKTGRRPSAEVDLTVTAIIDNPKLPKTTLVRKDRKSILVLNNSCFGELRRRAYSLIFHELRQRGVLPLRASAIVRNERAHLILGASETGKSLTTLLTVAEDGGWLGDQWVAVRFGRTRRDGRVVIVNNPDHIDAGVDPVPCSTLTGEPREIPRYDFDPEVGAIAMVSPLERRAYLPTRLARHDAELLPGFFRGRLENVPDPTEGLRREFTADIERFRKSQRANVTHFLGYLSPEDAADAVSRLVASETTHAIVDPSTRLGHAADAMSEPWSVPVISVTVMRRDDRLPVAATSLDNERFLSILEEGVGVDGTAEPFGQPCRIEETDEKEKALFRRLAHATPLYSINSAAAAPTECAFLLGDIIGRQPTQLRVTSDDLLDAPRAR